MRINCASQNTTSAVLSSVAANMPKRELNRFCEIPFLKLLFGLSLLISIYYIAVHNYLFFHVLVEAFSVIIAFGIFIIIWNCRRYLTNNFYMVLGVAYFFIGALDLLHAFAYKGMGVFTADDANLPTQLWIVARYVGSISFLIAFFYLKKDLNAERLFCIYFFSISLILLSIHYGVFPDCFIEDSGLTIFKKTSEYIIASVLISAVALSFKHKDEFNPVIFRLIIGSLTLTILAELAFTFYISVYGFSNFIGHFLKVISFYLLYKAVIETSLQKPFESLFRNLKKSESRYRLTIESMHDPIYICSSDFKVEFMNSAMIGRIGRNITGERCYYALHGLNEKCGWCVHDKVMAGKTVEKNIVSPLDNRTYRVTNIPIRNDDETISKMSVFRDITDYLETVAEKKAMAAQLYQSQKIESIGTLAGGIAHDFNNILSAILGYVELSIEDAEKGSLLEENLQEVYTAGRRARDLVKQILTFARQSDDAFAPVRVAMVAKEALKFIRASIPSSIEIIQNFQSNAVIMGNPTQIYQIFINLCVNAAQAMENNGGVLTVDIAETNISDPAKPQVNLKPGPYIKIAVSDNGPGIAPNMLTSIFDPYFTTKLPGEGTGMGLSMVYGIVKRHHGEISVESQLGAGAAFIVYLPVTKKTKAPSQRLMEKLPQGNERILLVDDESSFAEMTRQTLARLGYPVEARTNSIEALALFQSRPNDFDLVITNMTMPNMTGDVLAKEIAAIRGSTPVIVCTGYSKRISEKTFQKMGFKALLYKPITKSKLAICVRNVLDEPKPSFDKNG